MANENLAVASRKTQFSSTNQPPNKGRKKKMLTVTKDLGYSKDDLKLVFANMIWHNEAELVEVAETETHPIIMRIVAKQIIKAYNDSDLGKLKELLEYTLGKPTQQINADVKTGGVTYIVKDPICDIPPVTSEYD